MNIRQATLEDMEVALDIFSRFLNETRFGIFTLNADKALLHISDLIRRKCVVFAVEGDVIHGALALEPMAYPFTDDACLSQKFFYVYPEKRASRAAVMLRDSALEYAERARVPLFMDHMSGVDTERKDAFFEAAGFEKIGSTFIYGK